MVDFLEGLGYGLRGLAAIGTAGLSEVPFVMYDNAQKEQRERQALSQLQNAIVPPPFMQADLQSQDPAIRQNAQAMQQRSLLSALSQIDPTRAAELGLSTLKTTKGPTPLSPLGKQLADIEGGFIPEAQRDALINRATQPRQPLVQLNTGELETARQKALGKGRGEARVALEQSIDESADSASRMMGQINILESQLDKVDITGAVEPLKTSLLNIGQSIGIPLTESQREKLTANELIDSISTEITINGAKRLGSNPSNKDSQLLKTANASLGKSKEANLGRLDILRAEIAVAEEIARIKDDSIDLSGVELRKKIRDYYKTNPITNKYEELQRNRAAARPVLSTPQPITPVMDNTIQQEINELNAILGQ